jgi:hypothetical protein
MASHPKVVFFIVTTMRTSVNIVSYVMAISAMFLACDVLW